LNVQPGRIGWSKLGANGGSVAQDRSHNVGSIKLKGKPGVVAIRNPR